MQAGTVVGGYRLLSKLGAGSTGAVYLAQPPDRATSVALKVVDADLAADPAARDRFYREVEALCALSHPGLVEVLDGGIDGDVLWLSTEYVRGTDLGQVLHRQHVLPPAAAVGVGSAVGAALDHLHGQGQLHRDVKPSSILVEPRPDGRDRIVLGDFGIARAVHGTWRLTGIGQAPAAVAYAAPEQVRGEPLDHRSDVYSLAAVLFEAFTGRRPFAGEDTRGVLRAIATEPPPAADQVDPRLPADLGRALARGLAKDPRRRPGSCGELVHEVAEACGEPLGRPVTLVDRVPPPTAAVPPAAPPVAPAVDPPAPPAPHAEEQAALGAAPARRPGRTDPRELFRRRRWTVLGVAAVGVVIAVWIGLFLTGGPAITRAQLELRIATAIEGQLGVTPQVSCPGDLDAEVGATTECTATDPGSGEDLELRVTVTSVEGETAQFDIEPIE